MNKDQLDELLKYSFQSGLITGMLLGMGVTILVVVVALVIKGI